MEACSARDRLPVTAAPGGSGGVDAYDEHAGLTHNAAQTQTFGFQESGQQQF